MNDRDSMVLHTWCHEKFSKCMKQIEQDLLALRLNFKGSSAGVNNTDPGPKVELSCCRTTLVASELRQGKGIIYQ